MKTKIPHLILTSLFGATLTSQAAVVFTDNFDGQSISHVDTAGTTFGAAGSDVLVGEWFTAANGIAINNEIQLTNFNAGRSRGAGIWLDTSTWVSGTYTVEFDILDYAVGGTGSESFFQAYSATGVDASNTVSFDLHAGGATDPIIATTGSPIVGTVGARNTITANATAVQYTFDYTAGDDIALIFHNMSGTSSAMPVYSIDNLTVTVPEPSSTTLLGLGLSSLLLRRKRS